MIQILTTDGRVITTADEEDIKDADGDEQLMRRMLVEGTRERNIFSLFAANLAGLSLAGINFNRSLLCRADLTGADLTGANFVGADLENANLRGAKLAGAELRGADLSGADLTGADLGTLLDGVPTIPNFDVRMEEATRDGRLDMEEWHGNHCDCGCTEPVGHEPTCGTTHCIAGWAVHLAGRAGYDLEIAYGVDTAGALIYVKNSKSAVVPNFYTPYNEDARAELVRRAGLP